MSSEKKFRIYTRTGDKGTSCLYTGQRLPKDCAFFEALGDVDELNSAVGVAREWVADVDAALAAQLGEIQSRLLDIGSAVATPANSSSGAKVSHTRFDPAHTATLEAWLDAMDDTLPPLSLFILPSGGKPAALLHVARSVCRRAERAVVALGRLGRASPVPGGGPNGGRGGLPAVPAVDGGAEGAEGAGEEEVTWDVVDPAAAVYLNRLSDYLFTAARYMAAKCGHPEVTYQKARVTKGEAPEQQAAPA